VRIVFDTNVLFAAYIARGTCATLYEQALAAATLLTSETILQEFKEKLVVKGKVEADKATRLRAEIAANSSIVPIEPLPKPVCRDPDDDAILATAVAAHADLLVTGDKDLLVIGSYQGIPIVTPADCLARLREPASRTENH
jgi:putative PIN family toxin of toxin-antitoxin system